MFSDDFNTSGVYGVGPYCKIAFKRPGRSLYTVKRCGDVNCCMCTNKCVPKVVIVQAVTVTGFLGDPVLPTRLSILGYNRWFITILCLAVLTS